MEENQEHAEQEHAEQETGTIVVTKEFIESIQGAPAGVEILLATLDVAEFLAKKNTAYGNSALDPVRIFSKADPKEQLRVRIDDKLSRMISGGEYPGDNDIDDLIGYLILYKVAEARE